jgi:hypothetical protein
MDGEWDLSVMFDFEGFTNPHARKACRKSCIRELSTACQYDPYSPEKASRMNVIRVLDSRRRLFYEKAKVISLENIKPKRRSLTWIDLVGVLLGVLERYSKFSAHIFFSMSNHFLLCKDLYGNESMCRFPLLFRPSVQSHRAPRAPVVV